MNFENIFILHNLIRDRSRGIVSGILIRIAKVTSARSSLVYTFSSVATKVSKTKGGSCQGGSLSSRRGGATLESFIKFEFVPHNVVSALKQI